MSALPCTCYCTTELLSWRGHLSAVCKACFFGNRMQMNTKFGGKMLIHYISRPVYFAFQHFKFLQFFFSFSLTWDPMGVKVWNDISFESMQQIHSKQFMHTPMEGVYQICSKNCTISNFWFLSNLLSFSLTWDHTGVKVSNDIFSERKHQIPSPKFIYTHREGLKNCEIWNFKFLTDFFVLFLGRLIW